MKSLIKSALVSLGYEIRRVRPASRVPGSNGRPIGDVCLFLEDMKARGFAPRGIIDVGAHQGSWTRMAISVFPNSPVILIEPQREMKDSLESLVRDFPVFEYIAAGVGRTEGELTQTIWPDYAGSSFLPQVDPSAVKSDKQRLTKIVTLDAVVRERAAFHPDLVKLDIQGFELEALAGGQTLFGMAEVFIVETSLFQGLSNQPVLREVIGFMADRGYEVYDVTEWARRPRDGALAQIDFAFVKAGGRFRTSSDWN